jgi:hypothetical protein
MISNEFVKKLKKHLIDLKILGYSARKWNNIIFIYRRRTLVSVYFENVFNFYEFDDFLLIKLKTFLEGNCEFRLNLNGKLTKISLLGLLDIGYDYSMLKNSNLKIGNYLIDSIY